MYFVKLFLLFNLLQLSYYVYSTQYTLYNDVRNAVLCEVCILSSLNRHCNTLSYMEKLVVDHEDVSSTATDRAKVETIHSYYVLCKMTNPLKLAHSTTISSNIPPIHNNDVESIAQTIFEGQLSITSDRIYYELSNYLTAVTKEYRMTSYNNFAEDHESHSTYEETIMNILHPKLR